MARFLSPVLVAALFLFSPEGQAKPKTVKLNIDKQNKYDKRVMELEQGDTVVFENGESFKLGKFLGMGSENRIFALDDDHVIRIPSRSLAVLAAENTVKGAELLVALGVPAVRVEGATLPTGPRYPEREYVLAERVKPRFSFTEFLNEKGAAAKLSAEDEAAAADAFVEFAAKTALFEYLSAAGPDQLIYTKYGNALLVDWSQHHRVVDPRKVRSEKAFLKQKHLFSLMMEKAPGGIAGQQTTGLKPGYDEFDIGQTYLGLSESRRWLAIKSRLQSAIDEARVKIYREYSGNLRRAINETGKKNLSRFRPLNYRLEAGEACARTMQELLSSP